MDSSPAATLWMFLLSGLALAGLGAMFLWKPERRAAFFRPINPSLKPALTRRLAGGLLAVGILLLLAYLFEVIPYAHSKPYWIVVLSLVLTPIATLGFTAIFFTSIFKRK